jgi:hypothetical protein
MSTFSRHARLRQRADYTHKFNATTGRHGWLRLTPAYSVKIVEELISRCDRPTRVFDPFCGTATTGLSAAYHGHDAVTNDINPFLVWLGQVKTVQYLPGALEATQLACARALALVERGQVEPAPVPPIHKSERWWDAPSLLFLRRLRAAIESVSTANTPERNLLMVAFCRTLIALSNAAFNHQSMSFRNDAQVSLPLGGDTAAVFAAVLRFVLRGAAENPEGSCAVILGDSRAPASVIKEPVDLVITSPPYANRMSYIRELRPYMYWLGFLESGRDAGELDWSAIGGTWGIATSRLVEWERNGDQLKNGHLESVLERIAHNDNKSGRILANYVAKYFDDMWAHFQGLTVILAPGAEVHYVVGNSTFYGVLLSVEEIYAAMLKSLGFEGVSCRPIRKRNSKKELIEFDVTARWRGASGRPAD